MKLEILPPKFKTIAPEVKNLLEMFEFYLVERNLKKPIDNLSDIVRDMRIIIQRLLNFFLTLPPVNEEEFTKLLAEKLAATYKSVPAEDSSQEYMNYCIEQILLPFEWATEIKLAYSDSPEMQRMLAADIPILRPFDYGLHGKLKVIRPKDK